MILSSPDRKDSQIENLNPLWLQDLLHKVERFHCEVVLTAN